MSSACSSLPTRVQVRQGGDIDCRKVLPVRFPKPQRRFRHTLVRSTQWEQNFEEGPQRISVESEAESEAVQPRSDDVLPDNLLDSLRQAADATTTAMSKGVTRATIEILLPEFWDPQSGAVFAEEGDQMRFWQLTKRFVDNLIELCGRTKVTVIYPDMGVAAYLSNAWGDVGFRIASLNDRVPLTGEEDLIVVAAPDPPSQSDCMRVNSSAPEDVPLVLFNPRLASGDVGVGLAVRRMREQFLQQFTTTYSIRPIGDIGTVFRSYPEMWRVFIQDETTPGRFKLIAERPERPAGDALDYIIMEALDQTENNGEGEESGGGLGLLQNVGRTMASVQRFMRSLQN